MGNSKSRSKLYSFYKAVITVIAFAACFYLLIVCFTATYRQISDIGSYRILFLNPVLIVLSALIAVFALGIYLVKSQKALMCFSKLDDPAIFMRVMSFLKVFIFIESILFVIGVNEVSQSVDQLSVQQAAYSFSWNETELFTPPGYLGIYPNNLGMAVILYLLSFVTGHYNNMVIMFVNAALIPLIYSDLSEIGGRFGLSNKGRILVMAAGVFFLPLQLKALVIYGDVPGLFFAVRAMKLAAETVGKKTSAKKNAALIAFPAVACLFKNNYIIFAIAIMIYLAAELLRQKRFKELYIPVALIAGAVLINPVLNLITGAVIGKAVSEGASKWSWIAMGMQEEAGTYNGYNAASYVAAGFDQAAHSAAAKESIMKSLGEFAGEPNYALGFYLRKVLVQWSDPTHGAFEFPARYIYLEANQSPLLWILTDPLAVRITASFLKVFQLLMFTGSAVMAVSEGRRKSGSPVLLLLLTFIGGYVFHLIWEAGPGYTMAYMAMLIPVGTAGMIRSFRKLSEIKFKELSKARFNADSGVIFFIAGALVFLLAAAGLGTVKNRLAEGRKEYKDYYANVMKRSRDPIDEGIYIIKPAAPGLKDTVSIKARLVKYAGKYRMMLVRDAGEGNIYLTVQNSRLNPGWFSNDETQVFSILKNKNGTYTVCNGYKAFFADKDNSMIRLEGFTDYPFLFYTDAYENAISEKPGFTWNFVPAS